MKRKSKKLQHQAVFIEDGSIAFNFICPEKKARVTISKKLNDTELEYEDFGEGQLRWLPNGLCWHTVFTLINPCPKCGGYHEVMLKANP